MCYILRRQVTKNTDPDRGHHPHKQKLFDRANVGLIGSITRSWQTTVNRGMQPFFLKPVMEIKQMSDKLTMKPLALAVGAVFVTSLASATVANAAENPFAMSELSSGYMVAEAAAEGGGEKKMEEGKCGEGKCGGEKKAKEEGKCGEGKCGGDKKAAEEGKCGEGMKKEGEGKCGGDKK